MTELMLSEAVGVTGKDVMFSSNDTPLREYEKAAAMGAYINLDDITQIAQVEKILGHFPKSMCCRFNPGGVFQMRHLPEC